MIADEDYMIRVAEEPTVLKSGPNESDLRRVCLWMMVVSSVLIGLMLVISHYEQSSPATEGNTSQSIAGWIAVVGAAIVFGSTGVPMKSPALVSLEVDSFIFALYTSVGIFLVSLPLIVYLLVIGRFEFKFWAILGAADIVIIGTPLPLCRPPSLCIIKSMVHFNCTYRRNCRVLN